MEHRAADGNLRQLKRDGAGMAGDPRTYFGKPYLQTGERPVHRLRRKVCALQEDAKSVGQRVKLKTDLVLDPALAGRPRPLDCLLALFDLLLGGARLVVAMNDPLRVHRQVCGDKADTREQPAGMPLTLAMKTRAARQRPNTSAPI
jgi:hypothetical protein